MTFICTEVTGRKWGLHGTLMPAPRRVRRSGTSCVWATPLWFMCLAADPFCRTGQRKETRLTLGNPLHILLRLVGLEQVLPCPDRGSLNPTERLSAWQSTVNAYPFLFRELPQREPTTMCVTAVSIQHKSTETIPSYRFCLSQCISCLSLFCCLFLTAWRGLRRY